MRPVDAFELATDVLPVRWLRWPALLLLAGMLVTQNYSPIIWFVTAKAIAIQEDVVQPMIDNLLTGLLIAPTPSAKQADTA